MFAENGWKISENRLFDLVFIPEILYDIPCRLITLTFLDMVFVFKPLGPHLRIRTFNKTAMDPRKTDSRGS